MASCASFPQYFHGGGKLTETMIQPFAKQSKNMESAHCSTVMQPHALNGGFQSALQFRFVFIHIPSVIIY